MSLAERIIVMNRGAIGQQGTPVEIYSRPGSRFVAEFMGRSNWFKGEVSGQSGPDGRLFSCESGMTLQIPAPAQMAPGGVDVCKARAGRPRVGKPGFGRCPASIGHKSSGRAGCGGRAARRRPAVLVELTGGELVAVSLPSRMQDVPAVGEPVTVRFSAQDCIVVPSEA